MSGCSFNLWKMEPAYLEAASCSNMFCYGMMLVMSGLPFGSMLNRDGAVGQGGKAAPRMLGEA